MIFRFNKKIIKNLMKILKWICFIFLLSQTLSNPNLFNSIFNSVNLSQIDCLCIQQISDSTSKDYHRSVNHCIIKEIIKKKPNSLNIYWNENFQWKTVQFYSIIIYWNKT